MSAAGRKAISEAARKMHAKKKEVAKEVVKDTPLADATNAQRTKNAAKTA